MRLYGTYDVADLRDHLGGVGARIWCDLVLIERTVGFNQCEGWVEYCPVDRDGEWFIDGDGVLTRKMYGAIIIEALK